MKIKNEKDFFAGLLFLALGAAFSWGATMYPLGTAAAMGPGYFPLLVGILMAVLGALIMFKALVIETEGGGRFGAWAWKPVIFVLGGNLVFGLLLAVCTALHVPAPGMVVAIYGLTVVSSMAGDAFSLKQSLLLATVLALGCYLVFVLALGMPLPMWPGFLSA